jgi:uncharacterized membrane protein SpoIIM required for sporulation
LNNLNRIRPLYTDFLKFGSTVRRALSRARLSILMIALAYLLAVGAGFIMAHTGNEWALSYRDNLVAKAGASPTLLALDSGDPLSAALLDFGANLFSGAADTLGGLGVFMPFLLVAYRGWVGGIVSVDSHHASRLGDPLEAAYYLSVLILQLIPYTLAAGAGVNLGIAYFRPRPCYQGAKWLGLPREAILDVFRIYVLVVPLFLSASLWEFLSPWNR